MNLGCRAPLALALLLGGCAAGPDHFYTLNPVPDIATSPRVALTTHVLLDVTVPPIVDRSEMVVNTSKEAVLILDHERWAAPFVDQVSQALVRDIEGRRPNVLVADRNFDPALGGNVHITIAVVNVSVRLGADASLEAHWRVTDARAGVDAVGSDVFETPLGTGYPAIAQALSVCVGLLADRLVQHLPSP